MDGASLGDRLINERVASELLGLSVITLRNWRFIGKGPSFVKLGRAVRYSYDDLKEYISQRKINPSADG